MRPLAVPFLLAAVQTAAAASSYPIDYAIAPATTPDAASASVASETELGTCTCDLTAIVCDALCCCDNDCSSAEVEAFPSCLPEGPVPTAVRTCVDGDAVAEVNARRGEITLDNLATGELCVVVDNNPSLGEFFTDPGTVSESDFQQLVAARATSFTETSDDLAAASSSARYAFLDGLRALSGQGVLGDFTVPVPGPSSAACVERNVVRFAEDVEGARACTRAVTAATCAGAWSPTAFVGNSAPRLALERNAGASSGNFAVVSLVGDDGSAAAVWDAATSTCQGAATAVELRVFHDGSGRLVSASAVVTTGDVAADAPALQRVSVTFARSGLDPSFAVRRSGNPGYLAGLPVLGGNVVTDETTGRQAVAQDTAGFLPSGQAAAGGRCVASASEAAAGTAPLIFGQDAVRGCVFDLTLDELIAACSGGDDSDVLPPEIAQVHEYVGMFGNADRHRVDEWTRVVIDAAAPASPRGSYSADTRTCRDRVTTVHYQFVTADYGTVTNAQRRILRAGVTYETGDWTYAQSGDGQAEQAFAVTTTVSFLHMRNSDLVEIVPPAPNPFGSGLPEDWLYPFEVGSPAGTVAPSGLFLLLAVVVAALVI